MSAIFMACFTSRALAAGNDVVADGCINILDYETQQQNFKKNATGDVNGDNKTDLKDVTLVMHDWKNGCVDDAQFTSQTPPPNSLAKTTQQTMTFTVKNTGNTVWSQAENYALIQARSQANPDDPYDPTAWGQQYFVIPQSRVLAGQSLNISINLTAPANPGTYPMIFRMANASQPIRFGEYTQEKKVSVYDPAKPNIVLILADDLNMEDWNHVKSQFAPYLQDQGLTFNNFILPTSLCCPSRASFLRGQYTQNTGIYTNGENDGTITNGTTASNSPLDYNDLDFVSPSLTGNTTKGGWKDFHDLGNETSTVATWVHSVGYKTMLSGKYMNKYDDTVGAGTIGQDNWYTPPGWDSFNALIGDVNHENAGPHILSMAENGKYTTYDTDLPGTPYNTLTNAITKQATDFISSVGNQPFFMYLAPHAPHGPADCVAPYNKNNFSEPLPYSSPQSGSFNESDVSDKPDWVKNLSPLDSTEIANETDWYHKRLCSMQQIRDQVSQVVTALTTNGKINNTYVIFTSDNGYHMGQHRLTRSKNTMYEEDIRVPFVIRGPNIPISQSIDHLVMNVDFGPTVAQLAGTTAPSFVDGKSFTSLLASSRPSVDAWRKQVLLTTTGLGGLTYGLRTNNMMYNKIEATGEEELYDIIADPFELTNLANNPAYASTKSALAVKLQVLRDCSAQVCRDGELTP